MIHPGSLLPGLLTGQGRVSDVRGIVRESTAAVTGRSGVVPCRTTKPEREGRSGTEGPADQAKGQGTAACRAGEYLT